MEKFEDVTSDGNENAFKRGKRVPDGAINLAWVKSPKLSPQKNIVVVDTSRIVEENSSNATYSKKIMYANSLGILEDEFGNQVIDDEYPAVADVFTIDETFSDVPGYEYKAEHILPFVHVSRYFHVDFFGLTSGSGLGPYKNEAIKIVDGNGREYVDEEGKPRYRISITAATTLDSSAVNGAYRVWAFVDTDLNENLYLTYNKIEVDPDGTIKNQDIDHTEVLNPFPYFDYRPEESDVLDASLDPETKNKKIYSTKPVTLKHQVLDVPHPDSDGYRVFVPKKAIEDPRMFQLFRWRVRCDFIEHYTVDPATRDGNVIKAGVVVTDSQSHSEAPYVFYNLEKSDYNATNVEYRNPLASSGGKNSRAYWEVNFDSLSYSDMKRFDILAWAPTSHFDFTKYQSKIDWFVEILGKTLIIDTSALYQATGFGIEVSSSVVAPTGTRRSTEGTFGYVTGDFIRAYDTSHVLFDADEAIGGWDFNDGTDDEYSSLTPFQGSTGQYDTTVLWKYFQYIITKPSGWTTLMESKNNAASYKPFTIIRDKLTPNSGNLIFTTGALLYHLSAIFGGTDAALKSPNQDETAKTFGGNINTYPNAISGAPVEGSYKFMSNLTLLSTRNKVLDDRDEEDYSTSWTYTSPWKSSWVIDGRVLSQYEIDTNQFVQGTITTTDNEPTWQRKLDGKTLKQIIDSSITAEDARKVSKSTRVYSIEVTNPRVRVPSALGDDTYPLAWTTAPTPEFFVPEDLGPHIIKDIPVHQEYEAGQTTYYSYPPKPYGGKIGAKYIATSQQGETQTGTWTATGTALRKTRTSDTPDDTDEAPGNADDPVEITMSWATDGDNSNYTSGRGFDKGVVAPNGIRLFTEDNYYSNLPGPNNNWNFWGSTVRLSNGSTGEWVKFLQVTLNKCLFFKFTDTRVGFLVVDGVFGSKTETAVRGFQTDMHLRYVDGDVDSETWAAIASQVLRMGTYLLGNYSHTNHERFYDWIIQRSPKRQISDGLASSTYGKRSWISNGPSIIWETFAVQLPEAYDITGVTVVPYVEGNTPTIWVGAIDVKTYAGVANLAGYDATKAMLPNLLARPRDGELRRFNFTKKSGNTVLVTIGQDGPSGWGTSRMLGVRDIRIHALVTADSVKAQSTTPTVETKTVAITDSGTVSIAGGDIKTVQATASNMDTTNYTYSNIVWDEVHVSNSDIAVTMSPSGRITFKNYIVDNYEDTNFTYGTEFGKGNPNVCYSMDENKNLNPITETGWITKNDGVKLLCTSDKKPFGFPTLPTEMGAHESTRHYTQLTINQSYNDTSIFMGFYDVAKKEFIVSESGYPTISYIEYVTRGPQNIYVGLISNYQVETKKPLPSADDAPPIPHRWAMPVYGVSVRTGSQISIEPLSADLGPSDVWTLPVRTGKFNRSVAVRPYSAGPLDGYISSYQGTSVRAFYQIVEADLNGWSSLYGRPNTDVKGEHPIILDDDVIQVRQAPILLIREPSSFPSDADPVRPVLKVYTRATVASSWEELPRTAISDYNVSNGTIYLNDVLESFDTNLIKVDYTTSRPVFNFKQYDGNKLNLNPYPGHDREMIGRAIYVYILPAYVKDSVGRIVSSSVQTRTIRFTIDPSIFDSLSPNYDPLAVQLGVVYITTALDINDLIMLDTRRRGGGAKDSMNADEINRLVRESIGYWDIGQGAGMTYQNGGFVVVRLPVELKDQFPDERDIVNVIERNITLGVQFKIEDLEGNSWS